MTDAELVRRMTDMYLKAYQDAVKEYERLWNLIDDVSTGKKKPPSFYDTPEKIAKWKQGFIRSQFRQENVVANIAKKLAEVGVDVRPVIKSYIHDVYRYNRELAIGGIKRAVNVNFDQYDKRQINILLDDEQPVFSKIAYRNLGKNGIIVERLQREFAAGIINGDDKTKMLKRVQKVTGQSRYQAWRVAQTERTRVSSQARDRVINEAAAQGVIVLKEWSTRMRNSREAHISLDGQRVASGEVFHVNPENDVISRSKKNGVRLGTGYDIAYPGDPSAPARAVCNCYCVLIPRVEKKPDKPIEQGGTAEQIEVKPEDITAKRGEDVTLKQKPVTATQEQPKTAQPRAKKAPQKPKQAQKPMTSKEWYGTLTQAEKSAVEYYTSGDGMAFNNMLRSRNGMTPKDLTADDWKVIHDIDSAIKKFGGSQDPMFLWRSVDASAFWSGLKDTQLAELFYNPDTLKTIIGKAYTDSGFMSTTSDMELAVNWGDFTGSEYPITVRFEVPKGSNVANVEIIDEMNGMGDDNQREWLFGRNTSFVVRDVETKDGEGIIVYADIKKGK